MNLFKKKEKCCICNKQITGYGNNANPVKEGKCCDKCNKETVMPARLSAISTYIG